VLIIIPARGTPETEFRRNMWQVEGIPVCCRAVKLAKTALHMLHPESRVMCSTEDMRIASATRAWGAEVPSMRPQHLSIGNVPELDVVRHCFRELGGGFDAVLSICGTSPFTSPEDLTGALELFLSDPRKCVAPICQVGFTSTHLQISSKNGGLLPLGKGAGESGKHSSGVSEDYTYHLTGAFTIYSYNFLVSNAGQLDISELKGYEIPKERSLNMRSDFDMLLSQSFASPTRLWFPVSKPSFTTVEETNLMAAFRTGFLSGAAGNFLHEFESQFASFCNVAHGIAVCNGTVAIDLALRACKISHGDEVIVPTFTYVAPCACVVSSGATPIFVDVNEFGTLDIGAVSQALSERTKAIIAVHSYGIPVDMDPLMEIADANGVYVIEDAAEAHGALYKGRRVGGLGHLATFSFFANKVISTGEGGMVVTNDNGLKDTLRRLRSHAMDPCKRFWHTEVGFNYRLSNLLAAVGVAQMSRLSELLERRNEVIQCYRRIAYDMNLPVEINPYPEYAVPSPWMACVLLPDCCTYARRDAVCEHLQNHGVETRPFFYPAHAMPPYVQYRLVTLGDSDNTRCLGISQRGLNLPTYIDLQESDMLVIMSHLAHALKANDFLKA